jgi:Fur family ferric uptake transcriptional regulator
MTAVDILYSRNLKRTSCREGIIEVMMSADHALSEHEIRERIAGNYDRTTFYRSFKKLEEHNVIHKIIVDNQLVKYAIDNSVTHSGEHAHFFCNECNSVKCIDSAPLQSYPLPEGYSHDATEVLIRGKCDTCKNRN